MTIPPRSKGAPLPRSQLEAEYIVCGRTDMRKGIRGLRLLCCRTIRWIPQTAACPCFAAEPTESAAVGTGWLHSVEQAVIQQQILEVLIDVAKLQIMSVPCPCGHVVKFAFFSGFSDTLLSPCRKTAHQNRWKPLKLLTFLLLNPC